MYPIPIPHLQPQPPQLHKVIQKDKSFGKKIKYSFYITLLFIVFVNSFAVLDKIQFLFTQRYFEFITENENNPTLKGYIASSIFLFFSILWILTSS